MPLSGAFRALSFTAAVFLVHLYLWSSVRAGGVYKPSPELHKALKSYQRAIELEKDARPLEAYTQYIEAIEAYPNLAHAYNNLGNLLANLGQDRHNEALFYYQKACTTAKENNDTETYSGALSNIGLMIKNNAGKEYAVVMESVKYFDEALSNNPTAVDVLYNKASAYHIIEKFHTAHKLLNKVIELDPTHGSAHIDLGSIYFYWHDYDLAVKHQELAFQFSKNDHEALGALNNKGLFMKEQGLVEEALQAHELALETHPNDVRSLANAITARRELCIWKDLELSHDRFIALVEMQLKEGRLPSLLPYDSTLLAISSKFRLELAVAGTKQWVLSNAYDHATLRSDFHLTSKLRIGYLSFDYRDHPMGHLTVGAFENHDRHQFHIHAYSYGENDQSSWRHRILHACDKFVDMNAASIVEAAQAIYEDKVDILVDYMAHTKGTRIGISALRPAPININYLGFPGTMGSTFTDFAIVDKFVVPPEKTSTFSETVVYLPNAYQVNDYNITIPTCPAFSRECQTNGREEHGLPTDQSVVFCNFNTINKMEPVSFRVWMAVLRRVPNSVLWLLRPRESISHRIITTFHREAQRFGIHPSRLIFAPRMVWWDHLARLKHADMFLDSFTYNAHSTAADALWANLPIVTLEGEGFPARVASSLLQNIGVNELITNSMKEFENLAVFLANNQYTLMKIRERIAKHVLFFPLFDSKRTTTDLEYSYLAIWDIERSLISRRYHLFITPSSKPPTASDRLRRIGAYLSATLKAHGEKEYAQAENGYSRILTLDPHHPDSLHLLGLVKHATGEKERAVYYINRAIHELPDTALFHKNLAEVYRANGETLNATFHFEAALRLDSAMFEAYESYANMLENLGQFDLIVSCFEQHGKTATDKGLHSGQISSHRAENLFMQYSMALSKVNKTDGCSKVANILNEHPDFVRLGYNLGSMYSIVQDYDQSNRIFDHFVLKENEINFAIYGKLNERIPRPTHKRVVVFYCYEYGNGWWKNWGPTSMQSDGLGGSEQAVIFLSRELTRLGYWVEIYGVPTEKDFGRDSRGVLWYPYQSFDINSSGDIFVAWRYSISAVLGQRFKHKYIWLHDVPDRNACTKHVVDSVDSIIGLSTFHRSTLPEYAYRKFSVVSNGLNEKFFRDGANDANRFVYGSAPNRGLETLLKLWPRIKQSIPHAVLLIYYGFTTSFDNYSIKEMGRDKYLVWKNRMLELIGQEGVVYKGMVSHEELAQAYGSAGFYLYPSTYPETGCISLMKAQAMGAIPITSRYKSSALEETAGLFDLGPRQLSSPSDMDDSWMEDYVNAVIEASGRDLRAHRQEMKEWARKTFRWSAVAQQWDLIFQLGGMP